MNLYNIEYQLHKAPPPGQDSHESDSLWRAFPSDTSAFPLHAPRGNTYDLALRYRFQPETVVHYTVTVGRYWWGERWFIILLSAGIPGLGLLLGFRAYRTGKRLQLAAQEAQKEKATQALRSVQAQLNPHFIFNALTSIQGLINRGDADGANQYLSDFSILMRNTLTDYERIVGSLDQELKSMETYLSLEQLRFHFHFTVSATPGLPVNTLEIPRLLLQPIIENAVKHGVAPLRERGYIGLTVSSRDTDLVISIYDNGPGFSGGSVTSGDNYGLRLTADRIRLLNQLNPAAPIELVHAKDGPGTTFTFIFSKWLA